MLIALIRGGDRLNQDRVPSYVDRVLLRPVGHGNKVEKARAWQAVEVA